MEIPRDEPSPDNLHALIEQAEQLATDLRELQQRMGGTAISGLTKECNSLVDMVHSAQQLLQGVNQVRATTFHQLLEGMPERTQHEIKAELPHFYGPLVSPSLYGQPRLLESEHVLEINIVDDSTIEYDGRRLELTDDERYFLNVLIAFRRYPPNIHTFLSHFQGEPNEKPAAKQRRLSAALHAFFNKLSHFNGQQIALRRSAGQAGVAYRLHNNLIFIDQRVPAVVAELEAEPEEGVVEPSVPEPAPEPPATETPAAQQEEPSVPLESAMREILSEGPCTAEDIAHITGLDLRIVQAFIERHRSKIGRQFVASTRESIMVPGKGRQMKEVLSTQFSNWAIASLEAAKARQAGENDD